MDWIMAMELVGKMCNGDLQRNGLETVTVVDNNMILDFSYHKKYIHLMSYVLLASCIKLTSAYLSRVNVDFLGLKTVPT